MLMSRSFVIAAGLLAAGPALAQEAKSELRADSVTLYNRSVSLVLTDPYAQSLDGLTVAPIDDSLRRHLRIPDHQGLVVTSIDTHSPSHMAGVFLYDVLLRVDDKPICDPKDLAQALRNAEGKAVAVTLVREGESRVIHISPRIKIVLQSVANDEPNFPKFWIGVSAGPVEPALRSQLRLPVGQGLMVLDVHAGSPAAKAGIQVGHILMSIDGTPLDSALRLRQLVEAAQTDVAPPIVNREGALRLRQLVEAAQARPLDLIFFRVGSKTKFVAKLTPEPYKPDPSAAKTTQVLREQIEWNESVRAGGGGLLTVQPVYPPTFPFVGGNVPATSPELINRLNALDAELKQLRSSLQKLEQAITRLSERK